MKREARPHFERVGLEVALKVAERENNNSRAENESGNEYSNFEERWPRNSTFS